MSDLTQVHVDLLSDALSAVLRQAADGTVAYIRCLPQGSVDKYASRLNVAGWNVYAVGSGSGAQWITADTAVDLRERKQGKSLLVVDPRTAGAGMDGIYSATREVKEKELFDAAIGAAQAKLYHPARQFASGALKQACRLGRSRAVAPYNEFDFLARCCACPEGIGALVGHLGLWPIAGREIPELADLDISAQMVERLLLTWSSTQTVSERVNALLLPANSQSVAGELDEFLRRADGMRWSDAVLDLLNRPRIWLGPLEPGFGKQELKEIDIVLWRSKPNSKPLVWSGLAQAPDGDLTIRLPREAADPAARKCKLEVRWKTRPANLLANSVTFEASIVTGSGDVLASRTVPHNGKETQRCAFTRDDFGDDIDEDGRWLAFVRVHPTGAEEPDEPEGETSCWKNTESVLLEFGVPLAHERLGFGKKVRALVEEAIQLSEDEFEEAATGPLELAFDTASQPVGADSEKARARRKDSGGLIVASFGRRKAVLTRPELVRLAEEDWFNNRFRAGRWWVSVRGDGSRASDLEFVDTDLSGCPDDIRKRLDEANRQMGGLAMKRCGFMGMIHRDADTAAQYVNAWAAALEAAPPALALCHTVEVRSLSGCTLGLIVLPGHPARVAWHHGYDELAYYAKYRDGMTANKVVDALKALDGAYMPAFLPGFEPGKAFLFGDTLGFYAVAMIRSDEREPQTAIALMARCLSATREDTAPAVGGVTGRVIGSEIKRYHNAHPEYTLLRVHALRPGDGQTTSRALGEALREDGDGDDRSDRACKFGYRLDLFSAYATGSQPVAGRFLSEMAERRRAGSGTPASEDRWMFATYDVEGAPLPVLTWYRRKETIPSRPAHLSIAFDTLDTRVAAVDRDSVTSRPLAVYGLVISMHRHFSVEQSAIWTSMVAPAEEGDKHPAGRGLSERIEKMHSSVLRAAARNLDGHWPALTTEISPESGAELSRLHELCDWVITVDRNAGIEYFDSPEDAPDVYQAYVIDCVPEREDLSSLQLVTSSSRIDEAKVLLGMALREMGLCSSLENCEYLLSHLKATSGRLAMGAYAGIQHNDLVAASLFRANCHSQLASPAWLSLSDGFLVPVGDASEEANPDAAPLPLTDMVYITVSRRGVLQFTFVAIKCCRLLHTACRADVREQVRLQAETTYNRWYNRFFVNTLKPTEVAIRRFRLSRLVQFYADKAHRHGLPSGVYEKLSSAIDKLRSAAVSISSEQFHLRGYIFCPEHDADPRVVSDDDDCKIVLFGSGAMPDQPMAGPETTAPQTSDPSATNDRASYGPESMQITPTPTPDSTPVQPPPSEPAELPGVASPAETTPDQVADVLLGHRISNGEPVHWRVSIQGNPHLMIVGLPGMGKTHCVVNLCDQLWRMGIAPIVFSYHDDLDGRLSEHIAQIRYADPQEGTGFNPMRVTGIGPHAWVDNVGMLRDIFASVFPELGDIQNNELREAIKESYVEEGFSSASDIQPLAPPPFQRFFDILRHKPKPNAGLMARLGELHDYGFFNSEHAQSSFLQTRAPVLVRLHSTQNEALQRAMSSFVLFNLYQSMFIRGAQSNLTHAIVLDEAHRASKLRLLPTMAKECRKYGIILIVASQEARDFDASLYSAVGNYLVLRVNEADAKVLTRQSVASSEVSHLMDRLKQLDKYKAMFTAVGSRPVFLRLKG